jgi:transcriptional regulator with XRE-family HTH domain
MTETTNTLNEKLLLRNRIIGLVMRDARERADKSRRECAAALGVSSATLRAYEEGRKPVSLPELEILAYVTNTPSSRLLDETPELEPQEESVPLDEILALRHRIVGALLRQARLEAGETQKDLAGVLGCSPGHISDYEYGERPIPLSELELLAQHFDLPLEHFLDDRDGPVGEWHERQERWRRFCELPDEVQDFVVRPLNIRYLEVAMKLAGMPVGGLRAIAEGLLDITY